VKKYLKWLFAALLVSAAIIYFTSDGPVKPGTFNPDDFARYDLLISDSVTLQIDSLVTDAIAKYDFSQTKIWFKTRIIVNHDTVKAKIKNEYEYEWRDRGVEKTCLARWKQLDLFSWIPQTK